jgi:hypothetical protein
VWCFLRKRKDETTIYHYKAEPVVGVAHRWHRGNSMDNNQDNNKDKACVNMQRTRDGQAWFIRF